MLALKANHKTGYSAVNEALLESTLTTSASGEDLSITSYRRRPSMTRLTNLTVFSCAAECLRARMRPTFRLLQSGRGFGP